jgi:hypothetical protein
LREAHGRSRFLDWSIKPAAMLVRGVDRYGHFERVAPAKTEPDPECMAVHGRAVALCRDCYLDPAKLGH